MAKTKNKEQIATEVVTVEVVNTTEPSNDVLKGDQVIIGLSQPLTEGKEYTVSADVATTLIGKGIAVLNNK